MELYHLLHVLQEYWLLMIAFFGISLCYASVGFGGGSSYLALLTLTALSFSQLRATALFCNIVVVSANVWHYQKHGLYQWNKVLPLTLFSIPLAFLGGYLKISQTFFFILLGITLLIAAILMWYTQQMPKGKRTKVSIQKNIAYGGGIGFISGMVGIGGGIFLAPLLHLTQWDRPQRIAATASLFILLNSIAGLLGQYAQYTIQMDGLATLLLMASVFAGGRIGQRISTHRYSANQLRKATAILIAIVSIRILLKYLI